MSAQTIAAPTAPDAVATGGTKRPTPAQVFFESWRSGTAWQAVALTVMAFVFALILGAVLLVVSNPTIMGQVKYLFTAPHLFFGQAWHTISVTYAALASGSVGSWA
ncbi:MAG: hypothetical protein FWF75_04255, partial [Propionibacteriaceae bacterium]|nr:hypothetical protein [Propionibacteriaceae bacterium]